MDLLEIDLDAPDWIGLAQDSKWRDLFNAEMNLKFP
jgi:hypothetical protein